MSFAGKRILVGVTGGIAAYKIAYLVRLFSKEKAEVKVVMTEEAKQFVTPLTLVALSKNTVVISFKKEDAHEIDWNNHVKLSLWADYFIIAPATANTISKMVSGACDNLLMAIYLSAKCPVYVAPAMDLDMYQHFTTKENISKLEKNSVYIIPSEEGELASGLYGKGRMAEPKCIFDFISNTIENKQPLKNKTCLITAGPTREPIDPVRYISNYSSGKMGYALAQKALEYGAKVILVSGHTNIKIQEHPNLRCHQVITAESMYKAVKKEFDNCDIAIFAAAVSDYKPKNISKEKIKKQEEQEFILEKTIDILKSFGTTKTNQFVVGFALETNDEIENAKKKLVEKNADIIVLNSLKDKHAGFEIDTNKVTIINKNGDIKKYQTKLKIDVSKDIFQEIIQHTKLKSR